MLDARSGRTIIAIGIDAHHYSIANKLMPLDLKPMFRSDVADILLYVQDIVIRKLKPNCNPGGRESHQFLECL